MTKKVLVIANLHHASPRIPGLITPLIERDWEVTIITPPIGKHGADILGFPEGFSRQARIVDAPYRGDIFWPLRHIFKLLGYNTSVSITEQLKKSVGSRNQRSIVDSAMHIFQMLFAYPDTERTWRRVALSTARSLITKERFDLILSNSPFPTSHIVAHHVQRLSGYPWVADFGDPWTWSQSSSSGLWAIRDWFETRLERKILGKASEIVTVSDIYKKRLTFLHRCKVSVIPNGYTFEPTTEVIDLSKKFTITHTGTIYTGRQEPDKLLAALQKLIDAKEIDIDDVDIRFYGRIDNWLQTCIENRGLREVVHQYGHIERLKAVEMQRRSQLLLFLNWEEAIDRGLSHLKIYEYLSAGRPIIATGGHISEVNRKMLEHTGAGFFAQTNDEIEHVLLTTYHQFKSTGSVIYNGSREAISEYSYRRRAEKLEHIFDRVTH